MDETRVPTVCKPTKIIVAKSKGSIGAMTSADSGTNVTFVVAASAAGVTIPSIGPGIGSGWFHEDEYMLSCSIS